MRKVKRYLGILVAFLSTSLINFANAGICGEETKCIWAFGNSITKHDPAPAVGWEGSWGMAASKQEYDYVHQLTQLLSDSNKRLKWAAHRENLVSVEKSPENFVFPAYMSRFARQANIVVIELGDNFSPEKSNIAEFTAAYIRIASASKPENGILVCVSTWWSSKLKDAAINEACRMASGIFVDISELSKLPANLAGNQRLISNSGVAAHPSDKGMRAIAEKIFDAVKDR